MTLNDKTTIIAYIRDEYWQSLCRLLREYLASHCPHYRRDEVEGIIGSWVGRMAIVRHQCESGEKLIWDSAAGRYRPILPEEIDAEIRREIDCKWDDAEAVYRRQMKRIDGTPPAEQHVKEVLDRIAKRKTAEQIDLAALEAASKEPVTDSLHPDGF